MKNFKSILENMVAGHKLSALEGAAARLMAKYERGDERLCGIEEHLVYVLVRMPATFAALTRAFFRVQERMPSFSPKTQLDLGTGPGTALFAAKACFPALEVGIGIEQSELFQTLFSPLRKASGFGEVRVESLEKAVVEECFDLVTASYAFGELASSVQERWIGWASDHAKVVLFVEPGTPRGWQTMLQIREMCLSKGARLVAPCTHHFSCPFIGTNTWCHEAVRLPRFSLHRKLKQGTLGYEDEKFSYLVAAFDDAIPLSPACGRIVHAPRYRSGHTLFVICNNLGVIESCTLSRKHKERYQKLKRAEWGDLFV